MIFISQERIECSLQSLEKLKSARRLDNSEYRRILETAYYLLASDDDEEYNLGLKIICHVAESTPKDAFVQRLLFDCIIESRVFLYHEMFARLDAGYLANVTHELTDAFAESFYTLDSGTVLTRDQMRLFEDFKRYKRLVVSAPTSFGKSRIVAEIIMQGEYQNIAVVLPTIALLNETYLSFRKTAKITEKYQLINSITQEFEDVGNVFILTPEKMDLLLDLHPNLKIDFFTMDEIYKIQDGDERRQVFTNCLYRLSNIAKEFYLIGPYFRSFSQKFLQRNDAVFRRYSAEIVQKDTVDVSSLADQEEFIVGSKTLKKRKSNDSNLVNILKYIDGQTLVYVGRRDTVETRAKRIAAMQGRRERVTELTEYITTTIDPKWSLIDCLKKGVAFHHSAIPRYIQTEIVDAFNHGDIETLVCTTTLTEGVNTSAKNVVIFDNSKADTLLSGFDVKNIKGRAGRFRAHFIGRVIVLEHVNQEEEKGAIEFSYYDNAGLTPEEAIQVDKRDLSSDNLRIRNHAEKTLSELSIPLDVVRRNKFIPLHNQSSLVCHLRSTPVLMRELVFSTQYPKLEQLDRILDLCYLYLFNEKDKNDRNFTIANLKRLTKYYVYRSPSIKDLIREQSGEHIDTKIRRAFSLISRYFEFALPRYLAAFENLFNFVYLEQNGLSNALNTKGLITKLEFGSVHKHEIALREAGVPAGIITKISDGVRDCDNIEKIRAKLAFNPNLTSNLTDYEKSILFKYV